MSSFTDADKEVIERDIQTQFDKLVSAINRLNAKEWSEYYSEDAFLSAVAGTDLYFLRNDWVSTVTGYFGLRDGQHLEPTEIRVTTLAPDLALMTSRENAETCLKDGNTVKTLHTFSMIWKKEQNDWKIIHSHESWVEKQSE